MDTTDSSVPVARPRLRGVLHAAGFGVACVVGTAFVVAADGGRRAVAAGVFAASVATMLAASSLYHRVSWGPSAQLWMRRLDHTGIFLLIAGTYTAVGLLSLHGPLQRILLTLAWAGAAAATVIRFCWTSAPRWLSALIGVALGWLAVAALPQLLTTAGPAAVALLGMGGVAYTLGAVVYARRKPDPIPAVFGFHELFHALTLVALACQYVAIAFFVVRVA
jgi:hemolysin III